ncbi:MAG: NTP transferase domain-containing protein, partial [Methanomicrobiales archaeon]|nr:NTP transferase domain-containing protein [Methanomicrobiales archaeon]
MRSAIVLVGGEARRAGGKEKYFFSYEGRTFIEHILDALRGVVDEIVLAARDPAQFERFGHLAGVRCVSDIRKGIGPTGGLH